MVLWHIIFWAILAVVLIGSEIATVQLISVWFAAGSLAAFISSFFGIDFYIQVIIFIAVSILLLLVTRPFVKKFLNSGGHVKTNSDSIVGKECVVKEEISNQIGTGRVFVDGLTWAAKSAVPDQIFKENEVCVVTDIQGVTLIVKSSQTS